MTWAIDLRAHSLNAEYINYIQHEHALCHKV